MTETATHVRVTGDDAAPAVWREDWLPSGLDADLFPELTQLREDYLRLKAQSAAESAKVWEIRNRIEAHQKERQAELSDAYLRGDVDAQVEDNTEALERDLERARERHRAAGHALVEHVNKCIATVVEHWREWTAAITEHNANVNAEAAELEAKLREVLSRSDSGGKLTYWLQRTAEAAQMPQLHFPYADIPEKLPTDPDELARRQEDILEEAMYGGSYTKLAPKQSRALDQEMSRPAEVSPEEYARVERELRSDPRVLS